jgi:hypothetical protein
MRSIIVNGTLLSFESTDQSTYPCRVRAYVVALMVVGWKKKTERGLEQQLPSVNQNYAAVAESVDAPGLGPGG